MNTVGERLKTLREGMKFSQKKMAELLNVTQPSINRYEHGQSVPSIELLIKYADYFDVSMDYITCRCDEPQGKLPCGLTYIGINTLNRHPLPHFGGKVNSITLNFVKRLYFFIQWWYNIFAKQILI